MAKYSEEMREQTAAYIIESKRSITQVAKEIGVNVNTLCRWVNGIVMVLSRFLWWGAGFYSENGC